MYKLSDEALAQIYSEQLKQERKEHRRLLKELRVENPSESRLKLLKIRFADKKHRTLQSIDPFGANLIKVGGNSYYNKSLEISKKIIREK